MVTDRNGFDGYVYMIAIYNNIQPFNHSNSVFTHKQGSNFSLQSDEHGETEAKQINSELAFFHNRVYISELWEYARWPLVSLHVLLNHKSKCTAKAVHALYEAVQ